MKQQILNNIVGGDALLKEATDDIDQSTPFEFAPPHSARTGKLKWMDVKASDQTTLPPSRRLVLVQGSEHPLAFIACYYQSTWYFDASLMATVPDEILRWTPLPVKF